MSNTKKYIPFLCIWSLNFVVLLLFSFIFAGNVVFGNDVLSGIFAALWTSFLLTFFGWLAKPVFKSLKLEIKGESKNIGFYFIVITVLIWVLARFPSFTGFGISRFTWALFIGIILEFLQWWSWKFLKSKKVA